jgi:hypothetical protein
VTAAALPISVRRGLVLLAGIGFAAVPTVGPYLALLGVVTGRVHLQRTDAWWWTAAALWGMPWLVSGYGWAAVGATGQALAIWLIFRSASAVRTATADTTFPRDLGAGLLIGLAGAIAVGLQGSGEWRIDTARSVFDLVAWTGNPALFAHAMLVLSALLAVILPSPRGRVLALGLGAVAVLVAGAQEAVLAWLVIAMGLRFVGRRGTRATAVAEWALVVLMVVVASGATATLGTGRTGYRVALVTDPAANQLRGTETASGDWWYRLGVRYDAVPGTVAGEGRTVYAVTKTDPDPWSRLQQIVRLEPGGAYVVSTAFRADTSARPGIDGWGRADETASAATLNALATASGWTAAGSAEIVVLDAELRDVGDGWQRANVAFRYEGARPLTWYVGLVPDYRTTTGMTTEFAEFQLIAGSDPRPYVPHPPERGLADLRVTRFPLWEQALDAIAKRPWWGWGPSGFVRAAEAADPSGAVQRPVVAHAHSLFLDTAVERGLVGLAGLLLLVASLCLRAVQQRDRAMGVVLLGVLLLALFDTTFVNGAIAYPLAAVLGWRAVRRGGPAVAETGRASAFMVRFALAAGDAAVGLAALVAAAWASQPTDAATPLFADWSAAVGYATLLWPAAAWASGLYPGYGAALHETLARSVRAATVAALAFAMLTAFAPSWPSFTVGGLLVLVVVAAVSAPLVRSSVKGALRTLRLWGRPVAILGTGLVAERIARHLLERPEVGLTPVMVFGDGAWALDRLPVTGHLEQAWQAVPRSGIQHLIVVPDATTAVSYDEVLRRMASRVRTVQLVPDLHGVPTSSVAVTSIGSTFGLEARNRLASPGNRVAKRAFDLAAVVVGGLAILPAFLAVAVWIRLDSPGPVFYRQKRVGLGGRAFHVWKFRSMVRDADARLADLLARDPAT